MKRASLGVGVLVLAALALPTLLHADMITTVYSNADAYVHGNYPNMNFGGYDNLMVNGAGAGYLPRTSYLNFDVTNALAPYQVFQSATLWLRHKDYAGMPLSISAHEVTGTWTEMGVTWNNQPGYEALPLDTRSSFPTWSSWDVSGAWPGTGDLDLALAWAGGTADGWWRMFWSTESAYSPYLEVEYIPEPSTLLLFGLGLPALIAWRRRKRS